MAESSTATQQLPSTSSFSLNVAPILAEIRVENISAGENNNSSSSSSSSGSSQSAPQSANQQPTTATAQVSLIPSSSQAQVVVVSNPLDSSAEESDEPEAKRKKFDHSPAKKNQKIDKLENRLASVLCCAVCLDLPKNVYQVSDFFYFSSGNYFDCINVEQFLCKSLGSSRLYKLDRDS